ncbi:MAG: hypothetical protein AAFQ68_08545 [Bacteroidota bacterium]
MDNAEFDPREFLLFGLKHFGIKLESEKGNHFYLQDGYEIEIEGPQLFKLIHQGMVVGPFGGVESLCEFIAQDIQLNHG